MLLFSPHGRLLMAKEAEQRGSPRVVDLGGQDGYGGKPESWLGRGAQQEDGEGCPSQA